MTGQAGTKVGTEVGTVRPEVGTLPIRCGIRANRWVGTQKRPGTKQATFPAAVLSVLTVPTCMYKCIEGGVLYRVLGNPQMLEQAGTAACGGAA